jgi:hypothetical protein
MPHARRILIAATTAALAAATAASAQEGRGGGVSLSAVSVAADHELLGSRLVGGAARVSFAHAGGRLLLRLGAEHVAGNSNRIGAPCAGLVRPGTCGDEPLRDEARMTTVTAGLAVRLFENRRVAVHVTADARVGLVGADTHGLISGGTISAGDAIGGGDLGLEGAWWPSARLPIALAAGGSVGAAGPLMQQRVEDGYTPFETAFAVRRAWLGLTWRALNR